MNKQADKLVIPKRLKCGTSVMLKIEIYFIFQYCYMKTTNKRHFIQDSKVFEQITITYIMFYFYVEQVFTNH